MTPDKEQVVEPLSAEDFWRTHCNDCGHDLHPMNVCSAIVGGDQNGPDYCPCAIDYPALAAEYQRAARTASVAGLDADLRRIAEDANHTHNWNTHNPDHFDLHCGPCIADRALAGTHERPANHRPLADAARTASVAGLDREARNIVESAAVMGLCSQTHHEHLMTDARRVSQRLNSAPSIEQEPGETLRAALAAALVSAMNTDDAQQFVVAFGDPSDQTGTWDLALDMADAILADLTLRAHRDFQQARSLGAAPVPEVEGDPFQMGDSAPSIEQEPGETLRAAAQQAARVLEDFNTGPSIMARVALRRALAANPQETER